MTDRPIDSTIPQFVDSDDLSSAVALPPPQVARVPKTPARTQVSRVDETQSAGWLRSLIATLDFYMIIVIGALVVIGMMMVFSTTFDLSYQTRGSETAIFFQHFRNGLYGLFLMVILMMIDYRIWRRFVVLMLLGSIASLIAVLLFGDDTFGARRALINGSYQPGELAELIMVIYMAAWLGSKKARVRSVTHGLIPFIILVGLVGGLVMLQPDLSTALIIFITTGALFFLAGANIWHLVSVIALGIGGSTALILTQPFSYAQSRVASYLSSVNDLSQANYHVQQAVIAFRNGGLFGRGLGQGLQKFGALPAPHTDSIFAVIGEELGLVGAGLVVLLYIVFVIRGFQISRRAIDPFGALLAAGITLWVATQALLNIAVMASVIPPTGVPLPFISFGGSSLVSLMIGVGFMLSVARVTQRQGNPERKKKQDGANYDRSRWHRGSRLSRPSRS